MKLGNRFRLAWYFLLTGAAGWVATTAVFSECWKPWGPAIAAVAAGATGTFLTEQINARRRLAEKRRGPREALSKTGEPTVADVESPAALLRPEQAVVAFVGRGEELSWLQDWCTRDRTCPVALVTGPGGVGKTRLAWELGERLPRKKWLVQRVQPGHEVTDVHQAAQARERVLLVVDYAETRSSLAEMLTAIASYEEAGIAKSFRVLLLARRIGEWWNALEFAPYATRTLRDRTLTRELIPALDAEHDDNRRVFVDALPFYAQARGRPVPVVDPPVASETLPVLVLHAAALVAVLDDEHGTQHGRASTSIDVLDQLLAHESRLWFDTARRHGLDVAPVVLAQVIAVVALLLDSTSSTETALHGVIRRVPELTDTDAATAGGLVRWLRQLYPAGGDKVDVLRPDLLAERHAANQLTNRPLLHHCFAELPEAQKVQALTVLARACAHHDQAKAQLEEILHDRLTELAGAAITATLQTSPLLGEHLATALAETTAPDDTLRKIQSKIPYPTVALSAAGLAVTQRIRDALRPDTQPAETAEWASNYATALAQHGYREKAFTASSEAVEIWRRLAEERPDTFLPDLAGALNNHSNRLADLGHHQEALTSISEAVEVYRRLAEDHPDAFLPDLAAALSNQSIHLSDLGNHEEALTASSEAVQVRRRLAEDHPDAFLPDLARALNNHSNRLAELGQREEALTASSEAVKVRRRLAEDHPDAFLPDLASSLNNQSNHLADLGHRAEALTSNSEAVRIYRQLAEDRPDAFLPDLAGALSNQSNRLADLGNRAEALTSNSEAVRIYRQLAEDRPDAFLPDLAGALSNQSNRLADLGNHEEALIAISEAVEVYRQLAGDRPDAFVPALAGALNNQSNHLAELGQRAEALAASSEAVKVRRRLAEDHPDAFLPDLASSLNNHSNRLSDLGQRAEALTASSEAFEIYRQLAENHPDAFLPALAASLHNQSDRLAKIGQRAEALTASSESVKVRRRLAEDHPDAFLPDLAASLNNHSNRLSTLGHRAEALTASSEAFEIYRQLTENHPDAFLPALAISMNNYSLRLSDLGRREEALTTIKEAIKYWSVLAKHRPSIHQQQLDRALAIHGHISEAG